MNIANVIGLTVGALDQPAAITWPIIEATVRHHIPPSQMRALEWVFVLGVRHGAGRALIALQSGMQIANSLDDDALRRARWLTRVEAANATKAAVPTAAKRKAAPKSRRRAVKRHESR